MNKLTLDNVTDFALTTDSFAFMQSASALFDKLTAIGGDNYIVSGCAVTGSSAASGYMVLNGILMPFSGGTITTNVRIVTTTETVTVDVGSYEKTSYHAEFGTSTDASENVAWADIVNINNIIELMAAISALDNRLLDAEDDILVNAQDIQSNADNIQGNADDIEALQTTVDEFGVIVYAARIYETSEDVSDTSKKTEFINKSFINSVSTVTRTFRLIFSTTDTSFLSKYTVEVTSNPSATSSTRVPGVHFISDGTGLNINLRDSSANAQLDSFWIVIRKFA